MAVFHTEDFVSTLNNNLVAEIIVHKILQISKNVDDSDLLLLSTRDLIQWTNAMSKILSSEDVKSLNNVRKLFQANGEIIDKLFKFVFCYREHYVDTLRHLTKELFKNILNLHVLSISTDIFESPLLRETTAFLLNKLPQHSQGKYGLLSCLAEIVGNNGFLEWYPGLPGILYEALKDINLYSHISELLETLFKKSLDDMCDSEFITVWLRPLLMSLNSESKELLTALNEHLLPKLFRIRPHSINFLLSEFNSLWKNNQRNCFSALITCVKFQQRQKREESSTFSFSLICENPKTTEIISQNIFQLIQDILPYNINCQAPAFRQQLVSYINKLLNRMVESKYSLDKKKQNKGDSHDCYSSVERYYQDFLFWLKKYLYSCLYPGANFPRRVTALNLLYLLQTTVAEMLPIVENFSEVQSLLCVLQDTYENNKIIGLKILQSTDIEIFETGDEQFLEHLLKTALILACSTKPPDTVTASYLFAFMVRCKTFEPLLLELLSKQRVEGLNLLPCCTEEVFSKLCDSSSFIALLFLAGELEKQLEVAQKSLLNAAASAPLYGVLACIRSILSQSNFKHLENKFSLDQWAVLMELIISLSIKVVNVVEPVVCNSSPEGYLPKDTDSKSVMQLQATVRRAIGKRFQSAVVRTDNILPESDKVVLDMVKTHAVTSQILLLCCWRAHKEVSLLFGEISERIPIKSVANQVESGIIDVSLVLDIGGYFMFQMTSVIHKGAFEQAYIGFSKFCHMLWRSSMSELRKLPKIWLNDVFLSIKGLNGTIPLCSTRRSAGLPFVVQAILTSEPLASSSLYKDTISKLLSMASIEEDTENFNEKVHALNILRALFRDASLSDELIHFVSKALKVSIIGFNSKIWAVRNSCTLLFTALMARIFGTKASQDEAGKKNRLSGRTFFSYYKDLYNFLYCELKHCSAVLRQDQATCSISLLPTLYPILLILGRLYPAPGEQDPYLSSFIPFINACARSPIWKVRVASAKAFIPLIPAERFSRTFKFLLDSLPFDDNFVIHHHNKFHGKCLQILHLLRECQYLSDVHKKQMEKNLAPRIQSILELVLKVNILDKCFTVKTTLLNIVLTAFEIPMNITIDSAVLVKLIIEITSKRV
ncbi:thyroid adenoma-associated protein homolog [Caerostris extrusa]|uniref:tRNA (32-2'-O)-methyltransferase regulator THADA n=1 Tax=Caerostris extrusa TaxID=172846 RepID=A0AAV4VPP6_CAEEX|nr:thyroid adenoma-associated protein homolog [Caerostris extrusa]